MQPEGPRQQFCCLAVVNGGSLHDFPVSYPRPACRTLYPNYFPPPHIASSPLSPPLPLLPAPPPLHPQEGRRHGVASKQLTEAGRHRLRSRPKLLPDTRPPLRPRASLWYQESPTLGISPRCLFPPLLYCLLRSPPPEECRTDLVLLVGPTDLGGLER